MEYWFAFLLSLALLMLGVHCHRKWHAIFPEDPPRAGRHQHEHQTPMAGFVPTIVALAAFVWFGVSWWVISGVALASATGFFDDRGKTLGSEMGWWVKGLLLAAATTSTLLGCDGIESVGEAVTAFLFVFAIVNATNFMDNTNGVSASLGALGLMLLGAPGDGTTAAVFCAGAAFLGFVPMNWPRPIVFLGDSGSLGLGMCLGYAALQSGHPPFSWPALAPIAIFAIDFTQVILARLIIGHPPWIGDRRHLTHIAQNLGLPGALVAPTFAAVGFALFHFGV